MIEVDDKDLKQFTENLKSAAKYAYPDAVRAALTKTAYEASVEYKKDVLKELTVRGGKTSNIVMKSIHYDKADYKEHNVNKMFSAVGQQAHTFGRETDQLKKQELGETIHAKGKFTLKATRFIRGGSYKKFVQKENLISRVEAKHIEDVARHPIHNDVKEQFKQAIAVAHTTKKTINFIPDGETSGHKFGIFQFWDTGTKKVRDKKGRLVRKIKGKAAKLLYPFKDKNQNLKSRPMLKPAADKTASKIGEYYAAEAKNTLAKEMTKNLKKGN